jgi:hypothetical protein
MLNHTGATPTDTAFLTLLNEYKHFSSRWIEVEHGVYTNKNYHIHMHMALVHIRTKLTPKQIIDALCKLYSDNELVRTWDNRSGDHKILCNTDGMVVVYTQYISPAPWIVQSRDFVFAGKYYEDHTGACHYVMTSVEDNLNPNFVRGRILLNAWTVRKVDGGVMFSYLIQVDPCLSLPLSLVNRVSRERLSIVQKFKEHFEVGK